MKNSVGPFEPLVASAKYIFRFAVTGAVSRPAKRSGPAGGVDVARQRRRFLRIREVSITASSCGGLGLPIGPVLKPICWKVAA